MKQANVRTIVRAASLVMVFFVVSRSLGILRDFVFASQFGTNQDYDAYLAAFSIPDFIFYVISGGALGSAFIPTFTGYMAAKDRNGAWQLASAIFNWLLLIMTTLAVVTAILAPLLVDYFIAPGFSAEQKILTANLMRWLLISTVVFSISGLAMGILHAHQHFLMPAIAPVVYNLAIIAGAWLLGPSLGVYGLVIGVVAGSVGHFLVQVPMLIRTGLSYSGTLSPHHPGVREVARLMGPRMVGLAAIQFNFVWDKILASGLTVGSIAGLDYGRRLMLLPQGIIAQAVASAAFPTFSALVEQQAWSDLQDAFTKTVRGILYLTIPSTIGLLILGQPIVRLFERGEFGPESTALTVWALRFYGVGLVAHSVVEIVTRVFYALHNTRTPVTVGILAMGINIGLSWVLLNLFAQWGQPPHGGIALASSVAVAVEMVWLLVVLPKQPGHLSARVLIKPLGLYLAAGGTMALSLWGFLWLFGTYSPWIIAPVGSIIGLVVYGGVTLALGAEEPIVFLQQVKRRLKRP